MKRHINVFVVLYLFVCNQLSASSYLDRQEFMDVKTAEKRYGNLGFSASKFKAGSSELRGKMAVSLIKGKKYLGKDASFVKDQLGDFTGNFFSSLVPAYLIEEGWKAKNDTWQLVFLLNDEGKITEVKIHKNCCTTAK